MKMSCILTVFYKQRKGFLTCMGSATSHLSQIYLYPLLTAVVVTLFYPLSQYICLNIKYSLGNLHVTFRAAM